MNFNVIPMSEEVQARLPGVKVLGCHIGLSAGEESIDWQAEWQRLHRIWRGQPKAEVASHPCIRAYTDFYTTIGLNPRQTPPSVQNIIQRFLLKDTLERFPQIHPIVDAVNLAAVEKLVPLGVFDAARLEGSVSLTLTRGDKQFQPLGADQMVVLPPGVLVLRDEKKVLSQFCYRDSEAQKVTQNTDNIWLLGCQVPGVDETVVVQALNEALALLKRFYEVIIINS